MKEDGGQGTAEQYSEAILETSSEGDWMACIELLTESRLLRLDLLPDAMEGAALALADGTQQRAGANVPNRLGGHVCHLGG